MLWMFIAAALAAPELTFTATDSARGTEATCTLRVDSTCAVWIRTDEGELTIALAPIAAFPTTSGDQAAVQVRVDRHAKGVAETLVSTTVVLDADHSASYTRGSLSLSLKP
jgi:hypothetical protein